jgi:hypothetical protein
MPTKPPEYSNSQLNFFKFASIVLDEFPEALRQVFKTMWDKKHPAQPWDDSVTVRNQLSTREKPSTKIPTGKSYEEWDCTALFKATIYAETFKDSATGQTLNNKYVRSSIPPKGSFRPTVIGSSGDEEETFALAIDQLRLLRNTVFAHPSSTNGIDKTTFHYYIWNAKMAFTALHYDTRYIDKISKLPEFDFPTGDVAKLKERFKEMQSNKKEIRYFGGIIIALLVLILAILVGAVAIYILQYFIKPSSPSGKTYNTHENKIGLRLMLPFECSRLGYIASFS